MAKRSIGGIAGIWTEEHSVITAAAKTRESGFSKFDAITPYPVHGMEEACGIKRSWIPYVTFVAGLTGLLFGLWLTWWTSAVNWPINVGGKPMFSWPAFIPVIFELTVLFAALCSVAALFYVTKMPKMDPPVIDPDLTSHKFAIFVPQNDVGYDEVKIERLFKEWGAVEVKKVAEY
ncbi:MAG: DUF3341 domain-containing protein [Bdellovibrionaceae bacterium]|jgi:hypothetical protein|nr:DUF3341 domain-containing protein [Pseudobdellovibrionaceae bacterium]